MIVTFGFSGIHTNQLYYNDEYTCNYAAEQIQSHSSFLWPNIKAFCIKGD
jgi:hypothetical protein